MRRRKALSAAAFARTRGESGLLLQLRSRSARGTYGRVRRNAGNQFELTLLTMIDFDVQRCTRRCAKTDRELRPGEWIYSALVGEGAEVVRYDYSDEAWEGPPEGAIGWWKFQIPDPQSSKIHWAPNDVMLDYLERLDGQADKLDERYVLALLLLRRRVVRLEETEQDETGQDVLVLYCPKNEREYRVMVQVPTDERTEQIQNHLAELLFSRSS